MYTQSAINNTRYHMYAKAVINIIKGTAALIDIHTRPSIIHTALVPCFSVLFFSLPLLPFLCFLISCLFSLPLLSYFLPHLFSMFPYLLPLPFVFYTRLHISVRLNSERPPPYLFLMFPLFSALHFSRPNLTSPCHPSSSPLPSPLSPPPPLPLA